MVIKIIVMLMVVLGSAYNVVLNIVRYRSASNPIPDTVSDVYDSETYLKWKRYSAEHCRLNFVFEIISCIAALVLLGFNAYAWFADLMPASAFFAVIILETVVGMLIDTVRNYISTMVIEQKYGFNRSSLKTFIFDCIKKTIFTFCFSSMLVYIIWVLHSNLGDRMLLLFVVAVFCFFLLAAFLSPVFMRIGNKFVPLEEGELKDRIMALLTKHGYKVKAIKVMDASRRTTKLNAYFTGFGKLKTIVLYDNLVNSMTTDEICAVFAHEMGHGLHKDVLKGQIENIGNIFLMSVVVWLVAREPSLYSAFGFEYLNYGFTYILAGIALGLLNPFTGMIRNIRSRAAEYKADKQAVSDGYGEAMITALKKLARDNFSHLSPSRLDVIMEYSHPPLAQRIERVRYEMDKMNENKEVK